MTERRDASARSPGAANGATPPGPATDRERVLLLECRLEQMRSGLVEAREEADRARSRLAEAAAREAEHARRYSLVHQDLAEARAEIGSLHRHLEHSEALRAEITGHLFETGDRKDAEELVRLRKKVLADDQRAILSDRTVARLRERVEELTSSRETLLVRLAEWQQLIREDGPEAADLSEFLAELRRDILELEHRNVTGEAREAELRERLAMVGIDPDQPADPVPSAESPVIPPPREVRDAADQSGAGDAADHVEASDAADHLEAGDAADQREAGAEAAAEASDVADHLEAGGAPLGAGDRADQPEAGDARDELEAAGDAADHLEAGGAETEPEASAEAAPEAGAEAEPEAGDGEDQREAGRAPARAGGLSASGESEVQGASSEPEVPRAPEPPTAPVAARPEAARGRADVLMAELHDAHTAATQADVLLRLGRCGEASAVTAVRPWTASPEPSVRAAAYEALGRLLERAPVELERYLRTGLADPDARVRRRVVLAAGTARGMSPGELLDPLREDPDPQVRRVVREVLRQAPPHEPAPHAVPGGRRRGNTGAAPRTAPEDRPAAAATRATRDPSAPQRSRRS